MEMKSHCSFDQQTYNYMKRILVPCDFSKQAENAFQFALDYSRKEASEVHLLHIIEVPVLHDSVLMPVLYFEEALFKEMKEKASVQFSKLVKKHGNEEDKIVTSTKFGPVGAMVLSYIEETKIDLVVMGTKGVSGVKEYLIGSNTEKVVRKSPVPVIAIKKYSPQQVIKNIVFPNTLHTETQEDLIMKVKALQHLFKAHLHIVFINTPARFMRDTATYERLHAFTKRFLFKDYTLHVFNDVYEEDGIISFAHRIEADMVAMGTHGRTGIPHLLSGSVAEDVVNHIEIPIWTYSMQNE